MPHIAYVNGRFLPHAKATVHVEDRGYQFSDGIYEYVAFYNGVLLDVDLHWKRLARSLKALQIPLPMPLPELRRTAESLIVRNKQRDGGLYLQVSRGVAPRNHPFPKDTKPSMVMTVCPPKLPSASEVSDGVKVITYPDQRWGRRDIKSISLLANVIAKQEATRRGAREAWLIEDNGKMSEGAVSNTYIITARGEIITHPLNEHILGGITRDVVLRLARKAKIKVTERAFTLAEAKKAAEAFLTSTSANVLPVVMIDGKKLGNGKVGKVTRQLQKLYAAHVLKQTRKKL